ncbi:MAG: Vitamin B12 dependent methionine synthase activation subunit, partial [Clostridia bacterium]|nr:Vitamin B12 dependent methionine synthase activation subunit [Clostridia bacterium]
IGIGLDRLIAKYSRISPSKAILFQGIGSERVEALCDTFCNTFKEKSKTFPRFSPGYGDLSLEVQKDVFSLLNCSKNTGIFLNDNLLMTPTKSVTAFMGIL